MHDIDNFRKQKDHFFGRDPHSPLLPEQKDDFEGLKYFDYDPDFRYELEAEEFKDKEEITMATSTGDVQDYVRWGRIKFDVDGEEAALTLYVAVGSGGFFLPFMDATSGKETYSVGRYLEVEPQADGKFIVDFNMAYNPYCAYNPPRSLFAKRGGEPYQLWSCPIPPKENRIRVAIRAGEKQPVGPWVEEETHIEIPD